MGLKEKINLPESLQSGWKTIRKSSSHCGMYNKSYGKYLLFYIILMYYFAYCLLLGEVPERTHDTTEHRKQHAGVRPARHLSNKEGIPFLSFCLLMVRPA